MRIIENEKFPLERALYNSKDLILKNCRFEGEEDGESAIKESNNIELIDCYMDLRYPFWHSDKIAINSTTMTSNCRAAMWYMDGVKIDNSNLLGIKALRECKNAKINNCIIESPEFGWKCNNVEMNYTSLKGEYVFLDSNDITLDNFKLDGKYSFQYVNNMKITNSYLKTKDAFWHTKDVVVENTTLVGEYLAWYSENLILINCHIKGTQPFCYCKNLKLINCTMEETDLSFENSTVTAKIFGNVMSIKNPKGGRIIVDSCDEFIDDYNNIKDIVQIGGEL